jgi:hypothetical protein
MVMLRDDDDEDNINVGDDNNNNGISYDSKGRGVLDFPQDRISSGSGDQDRQARMDAPAKPHAKDPFLSEPNPTRLVKRAIVMQRTSQTSKSPMHDVAFNPIPGKEQACRSYKWGDRQHHYEPTVGDKWMPADPAAAHAAGLRRNPSIFGCDSTSKEISKEIEIHESREVDKESLGLTIF